MILAAILLSAAAATPPALPTTAAHAAAGSGEAGTPAGGPDRLVGDGRAALEAEDPDRALELFDRVLRRDPASVEAAIGRATSLRLIGRTSESLAAWRRLAESHTASLDVLIGLAHAEWAAGQPVDPAHRLRKADLKQAEVPTLLALARFQIDNGDPAGAARSATQALKKDARAAEALVVRADALDWQKKWKRADADCAAALAMSKSPRILYLSGKRAASVGDYTVAVEHFTSVLSSDPVFVSALVERARARLELGQHDSALRDLHAADRARPGNPQIYRLKGQIYSALDDDLLARDYLTAAQRIQPENAEIAELLKKVETRLAPAPKGTARPTKGGS